MTEPDNYISSEYAEGDQGVTSSAVESDKPSPEALAVERSEAALKRVEDDSVAYETRRPHRRIIRATVNP